MTTKKRKTASADFEVESIRDFRMFLGQRQYLVKWLGFPDSDCTWEPESNLHNCVQLLKEFRHQQQLAAGERSSPVQDEVLPTSDVMQSLPNPETPSIDIKPATTAELARPGSPESVSVESEPMQTSTSDLRAPSPLVASVSEPTTAKPAHLNEEKSVTIIAPSSTTSRDSASPMPSSDVPPTRNSHGNSKINKLCEAIALSMFPEFFPPKRPRTLKNPELPLKRDRRKSNEERFSSASGKHLPDSGAPAVAPTRIEADSSEPSIVLGAVAVPLVGRRVSAVAIEHAPSEDLVRKLKSRILRAPSNCSAHNVLSELIDICASGHVCLRATILASRPYYAPSEVEVTQLKANTGVWCEMYPESSPELLIHLPTTIGEVTPDSIRTLQARIPRYLRTEFSRNFSAHVALAESKPSALLETSRRLLLQPHWPALLDLRLRNSKGVYLGAAVRPLVPPHTSEAQFRKNTIAPSLILALVNARSVGVVIEIGHYVCATFPLMPMTYVYLEYDEFELVDTPPPEPQRDITLMPSHAWSLMNKISRFTGQISVGDIVIVQPQHINGTVVAMQGNIAMVKMPDNQVWKGDVRQLQPVLSKSSPTDRIRVNDHVHVVLSADRQEPTFGWGGVSSVSRGYVIAVQDDVVFVDFPVCHRWVGLVSELYVFQPFSVGELVRLNPRNRHADQLLVTRACVGRIVGGQNLNVVNVRFPFDPDWTGQTGELEIVRPSQHNFYRDQTELPLPLNNPWHRAMSPISPHALLGTSGKFADPWIYWSKYAVAATDEKLVKMADLIISNSKSHSINDTDAPLRHAFDALIRPQITEFAVVFELYIHVPLLSRVKLLDMKPFSYWNPLVMLSLQASWNLDLICPPPENPVRWMSQEENDIFGIYRHLFFRVQLHELSMAPLYVFIAPELNVVAQANDLPLHRGGLLFDDVGESEIVELIKTNPPRHGSQPNQRNANGRLCAYRTSLIVTAPLSVDSWCAALNQLSVFRYGSGFFTTDSVHSYDVVVISYVDLMTDFSACAAHSKFVQLHWQRVIFDHASTLITMSQQIVDSLLWLQCDTTWCMTRTPYSSPIGNIHRYLLLLGIKIPGIFTFTPSSMAILINKISGRYFPRAASPPVDGKSAVVVVE